VVGKDLPFDVLAPGGSMELKLKGAKLPAGTTLPGKYLIAVIDPEKSVPETDTTNNTVAYGPFP